MAMTPLSSGITATPTFDYVNYRTTAGTPTYAEGNVFWDSTDHTLAIQSEFSTSTLQVGQEFWVRTLNKTGSTIADATAVYLSGAQGNRPTAAPVSASSAANSTKTLGLATLSIDNNAEGYITTQGLVRDVDTSTFTEGAELWIQSSAGTYSTTPPAKPLRQASIGYALNSTVHGMVYVEPRILPFVNELSDVVITSAATNDVLKWDGTKWINSPSGSSVAWGAITGTLSAQTDLNSALAGKVATTRTLTAGTGLTGGGDLSADRTLSVSFGTTASTACVGNDSRLNDTRDPNAHVLDSATHTISGKTAGQVVLATSPTTYAFTSLSGDATLTGAGVLTVSANAIGNTKLAQMAANTIKGNNNGSTSNAADLTADQVVTMLPLATTTSKGLLQALPSSGGTGVFLRGDGTWQAPTGGGTVTSVDVSGGSTGLTTTGGPVTGSGTITLSGTLAVANGGTGATTAANARTALGAAASGLATASGLTVSAPNFVLGRATAGTGAIEEIAVSSLNPGINYVTNPNAEVGTTGWTTYNDGTAIPVDGTGGTPSVTWTRNTTTPLRGTGDFLLTRTAVNSQGQGVATDLTIDQAYKNTRHEVSFVYKISSGTFASGEITVWIYDVTNAVMWPLGQLEPVTQPTVVRVPFNTTGSTSYRFLLHHATTNATSLVVEFDDFKVAPGDCVVGPAMSDPQAYTPTITGHGSGGWASTTGQWYREGKYACCQVIATKDGTAGTGSSPIACSIPPGLAIDDASIDDYQTVGDLTSTTSGICGWAITNNITAATTVYFNKATSMAGLVGSDIAAGIQLRFTFKVPVVGWSSNVILAQSKSFRLCEAYTMTRVTTPPTKLGEYRSYVYQGNGSFIDGAPGTAVTAANGFLAGGSSAYPNADSAGYCSKWEVFIGKNKRWQIEVYENAGRTGPASFDTNSYSGYTIGSLTCYDPTTGILTICKNTNSGATNAQYVARTPVNVSLTLVYFDVIISDPACVAEVPPTVVCRYTTAAGQSIPNATATTVVFGTKVYDSHAAYNTSTGVFTAPLPGKYVVSSTTSFASTTWGGGKLYVMKAIINGSSASSFAVQSVQVGFTGGLAASGAITIALQAGDTLTVSIWHNKGSSASLDTTATENHMSISRIGD